MPSCQRSLTSARLRTCVTQVTEHPEHIDTLVDFVHAQDGVVKAAKKMDDYISQAIACLDVLPETAARQYLTTLVQFVGDRKA